MSLDPSPELRVALAALDLIAAMQEQRAGATMEQRAPVDVDEPDR